MRPIRSIPLLLLALLGACDSPSSSAPGAPARMDVVSGDLQPGVAGQELPNPLVVKVLDDDGDPVPGALVNFVVTEGEGRVFAGAAQTNAQGEARERWTLGTVAGDTQKVEVRAVDATTGQARVFATFRAVAGPAAGTRLELEPLQTGSGFAGEALPERVKVYVADVYGNAVPGVAVTWAAVQGGGTLTPVSPVSDARGVAQATWRLGTAVGPQVGQASIPGQPPVTFTTQAIVGPVSRVRIEPRPLGFTSLGQAIPLTVTGTDAYGNPVAGATVTVVSLNSAVVSLTAPATAVSQANGATKIIATLQATGAADTVDAVVLQQAASIAVSPSQLFLAPGETETLTARARDARGNLMPLASVAWTTSNPAVATVAPDGTVTAGAAGTATLTATSGTLTAQVPVTVGTAPAPKRATMDVGVAHSCALTTAGEAYCWGSNTLRQLGNGQAPPGQYESYTPSKVTGGHTFVALGSRNDSTCGLTAAGAVYCWGFIMFAHTPVLVSGTRTYKEVDGECALTTAGEWHCFNRDGSYRQVRPGFTFAALDDCALTFEGQVDCGTGPIPGLPPMVRLGSGRNDAVCALTAAGQAYCRRNSAGWQPMPSPEPLRSVATATPARSIEDYPANQVCGISLQGHTFCGPTGNGMDRFAAANAYSFVDIAGAGRRIDSSQQYTLTGHFCALTRTGQLYCWGGNSWGELGTDTNTPSAVPVLVTGGLTWATSENPPFGAPAVRRSRR